LIQGSQKFKTARRGGRAIHNRIKCPRKGTRGTTKKMKVVMAQEGRLKPQCSHSEIQHARLENG